MTCSCRGDGADTMQVARMHVDAPAQTSTATCRSAEALCEGHDDPFWTTYVGHEPGVLVLADAADEPVTVGGKPIDRSLHVVDFQRSAPQTQFVGHGGRRAGIVVGPNEARELQRRPASRWTKHDDLSAGAWDAADGVEELTFDECPALDLKPETNE